MTSVISDIQAQKPAGPLIVHVVRQFLPNKGGLGDVVANPAVAVDRPRLSCSRRHVQQLVLRSGPRTCTDRKRSTTSRSSASLVRLQPLSIGAAGVQAYRRCRPDPCHAVDFFFDALAWGKLFHGRPMVATTHGGFFHTPK